MTAQFAWKPEFELGFARMDQTHREFVLLVDALLCCPDAEVAQALARFADHASRHFDEEKAWMLESEFPSTDCHLDEHAAVLKSVDEVIAVVSAGRISVARALAAELARWFPGHADSMDEALAKWLVKRRLGGSPVVIRRSAAR